MNPESPRPKHRLRKFLIILLTLAIVAGAIVYFICGMTYSEGTRSGVLVKISRKGYMFKTCEGEMNVGGFTGGEGTIMPATVFKFSVADPKVYDQLQTMQGHKIVVQYREVIHNFFWQGDTHYFVEKATYYK
jgi:hypothetical protein